MSGEYEALCTIKDGKIENLEREKAELIKTVARLEKVLHNSGELFEAQAALIAKMTGYIR